MTLGEISADSLGLWVGGLLATGAFVFGLLRTIAALRPRPSYEERFASKQECAECRQYLERRLSEFRTQMSDVPTRQEFEQFRAYVSQELGRLSGKLDSMGDRVLERLDTLQREMQIDGERRAGDLHEKINRVMVTAESNRVRIETMEEHGRP